MGRAEIILSLFKTNEEEAFKLLFETYHDTLLLYANQMLDDPEAAKDVVQNCFVDFWIHRRFASLPNGLEQYIFQSVKHATLNHLRGEKRRKKYYIAAEEDENNAINSEEVSWNDEALYKALNELPDERRKIFLMICLEGMKYQEVAEKLQISINTVKKQMGRSFKFLREKLQKNIFITLLLLWRNSRKNTRQNRLN